MSEQALGYVLTAMATIMVALIGFLAIQWRGRNGNGKSTSASDPRSTKGGDVSQGAWEDFFEGHITGPLLRELASLRTDHNTITREMKAELQSGFADMKGAAAEQKKLSLDVVEELRNIRKNGGTM